MFKIQLDNHPPFSVLSKEEITDRHHRALFDAGQLLIKLDQMDDEEEQVREVIVRILDSITVGVSRDQIDGLSDEEILLAIRLWMQLPKATMPPAVGRA
jgi:hypothetical protein